MASANVGLSTPRGSGTSGFVQRNLSHPKPRQSPYPPIASLNENKPQRPRSPDAEILAHERKRKIEVKVMELRAKLEDDEVDEEEVDDRCDKLREELEAESKKGGNRDDRFKTKEEKLRDARKLKGWQTHELAEAKRTEQEKLRKALGIRADYEEGGHWKKQEQRMRESLNEAERPED